MSDRLTHLDEKGRARMVNVGEKAGHRSAACVARGARSTWPPRRSIASIDVRPSRRKET